MLYEEKPLKDLFAINTKSVKPYETPEKEFTHYSIPSFDEKKVPIKETGKQIKSNKYVLKQNSILVSKLNPRIKRVWKYIQDESFTLPSICSTEFIVYQSKSNDYDIDFYYHYFNSDFFQNALLQLQSGSTGSRMRVSPQNTLEIPLPMPTVKEQMKVSTILNVMDEAIEKTKMILDQSINVKKGLMQRLLTKGIGHTKFKQTEIGEIPEEWEVKTLDEICDKIFVGIATSTTNSYTEQGVPIIRNQNIHEDYLDTSDLLQITHEFSEKNRNKKLISGDVLTVRTGYPGISCVVPKELEGAHTFTTLVSRPNSELVNSYYLSRYINSDVGKKFVVGGKAGGAQQNLNVAIMKKLLVALPPTNEQNKIIAILNAVDEKILNEKNKYDKLCFLKKGIMEVLLTGKVRVKLDK